MILLNFCKAKVVLTLIGFLLLSESNGTENRKRKQRSLESQSEELISGRSGLTIIITEAFDWSQYNLNLDAGNIPKSHNAGNLNNNEGNPNFNNGQNYAENNNNMDFTGPQADNPNNYNNQQFGPPANNDQNYGQPPNNGQQFEQQQQYNPQQNQQFGQVPNNNQPFQQQPPFDNNFGNNQNYQPPPENNQNYQQPLPNNNQNYQQPPENNQNYQQPPNNNQFNNNPPGNLGPPGFADDEQICGLPEADDNQICISVKLPWKRDPVYFCTPKETMKIKECNIENTTDACFDDGRSDSLKIMTPWDCCPTISTPNTCDVVKCPPEPFNRTCRAVQKDGECCKTFYCDKEDPTACRFLKAQTTCLQQPPLGKENCTRFRDPYGCCTKYQCDYEQKPGYCPRTSLAVKMVTKMALNAEGKQVALLVPQRAFSAETDLRCVGDYTCPGDQKCCSSSGRVNKLRVDTNDHSPRLLDGACRDPVYSEAESEIQGRSFRRNKGRSFGRSFFGDLHKEKIGRSAHKKSHH